MIGRPPEAGLFPSATVIRSSGTCTAGPPRDCSAQTDQCNVGVCNEATDACEKNPTPKNGTGCDDGQFCTVDDKCVSGTCTAGPPRDCSAQTDQCNVGECDEA